MSLHLKSTCGFHGPFIGPWKGSIQQGIHMVGISPKSTCRSCLMLRVRELQGTINSSCPVTEETSNIMSPALNNC